MVKNKAQFVRSKFAEFAFQFHPFDGHDTLYVKNAFVVKEWL